MSLTVTTEPKENRQLALNVEVDPARVEQKLRIAARKVAKDYRIPGFRKGKAPYHIIVQYFGKQALYGEIIDDLGQEVYMEAIEQAEIEPYAQASLEDISFEPLTYKLVVPLEPEVDLGDYRSVRVDEAPVEIDEEAVTARLESYQDQYAGWEEVERPSQYGDLMNIDVTSVIPATDDADEIMVLDETDWDVTPDEDNPMEPPGFDEALLGLAPGQDKEFELGWPEDSQSIYAGKTALFSVTVHGIQAYQRPALDDELAQLVGPDYETMDDLLEDIRDSLREEAEQGARNDYLEAALDAILEQATLSYPPVVVEDQIDGMVNEYGQRLRQFGIENLESYFEQTGQDLDEYREGLREEAEKVAQRNLIISEMLRSEYITASDEDIQAKIDELVGDPGEDEEAVASAENLVEMFRDGPGRPVLESQILQEKTLDRLLAIVRGEDVPSLEELETAKAEAEAQAAVDAAEADEESATEPEASDDVLAASDDDALLSEQVGDTVDETAAVPEVAAEPAEEPQAEGATADDGQEEATDG